MIEIHQATKAAAMTTIFNMILSISSFLTFLFSKKINNFIKQQTVIGVLSRKDYKYNYYMNEEVSDLFQNKSTVYCKYF